LNPMLLRVALHFRSSDLLFQKLSPLPNRYSTDDFRLTIVMSSSIRKSSIENGLKTVPSFLQQYAEEPKEAQRCQRG
ncbi:MAG: hypothetical protein V3T61_06460, partial [Acidobacteriota bacterium]